MLLKTFREQAGLTQKELGECSGVRQVTISKLERGDSCVPSLPVARKLVDGLRRAGLLDVTIDDVFPPLDSSSDSNRIKSPSDQALYL